MSNPLDNIDFGGKSRVEQDRLASLLREDEQPLVQELRAAGIDVNSIWELKPPLGGAIPILLRYLDVGAGLARHNRRTIAAFLDTLEARPFWAELVRAYRDEKDDTIKDVLAGAVGLVSSAATIDELISLCEDRSLGRSRVPLVSGLRKSRSSRAQETLDRLKNDPDLAVEVARR